MEQKPVKYQVDEPGKLKSWETIASDEIRRWLTDDKYSAEVTLTTLSNDENPPGPFTKFLYHFAWLCESTWGTMIDFNERRQKIYLRDGYYKWMHTLRDKIRDELSANENQLKIEIEP